MMRGDEDPSLMKRGRRTRARKAIVAQYKTEMMPSISSPPTYTISIGVSGSASQADAETRFGIAIGAVVGTNGPPFLSKYV